MSLKPGEEKTEEMLRASEAFQFLQKKLQLKSERSTASSWQQTAAKTLAVHSFLNVKEGRGLFGAERERDPKDYNPLKGPYIKDVCTGRG